MVTRGMRTPPQLTEIAGLHPSLARVCACTKLVCTCVTGFCTGLIDACVCSNGVRSVVGCATRRKACAARKFECALSAIRYAHRRELFRKIESAQSLPRMRNPSADVCIFSLASRQMDTSALQVSTSALHKKLRLRKRWFRGNLDESGPRSGATKTRRSRRSGSATAGHSLTCARLSPRSPFPSLDEASRRFSLTSK